MTDPKGHWEHWDPSCRRIQYVDVPSDWETGREIDPIQASVSMARTTFRTYTLTLGDQPVPIVTSAPYPQRVVLEYFDVAPNIRAIVAANPNDLAIPTGAVIPGGVAAVGRPTAAQNTLFTVAPNQRLYAAADPSQIAIGTVSILSVSASQVVPVPDDERQREFLSRPGLPTTFRTFPVPALPVGIPIVGGGRRPKRVVVRAIPPLVAAGTRLHLTSESGEISIVGPGGPAFPAGSYGVDLTFFLTSRVFILAPAQPLLATMEVAGAGQEVSVSVSEVNPLLPRGPTGVPGPDAQE